MKKDTSHPAFPSTSHEYTGDGVHGWNTKEGMTLRDYFAAKAMQATDLEQYANTFGDKWAENVAADSYHLADEMLKQREL